MRVPTQRLRTPVALLPDLHMACGAVLAACATGMAQSVPVSLDATGAGFGFTAPAPFHAPARALDWRLFPPSIRLAPAPGLIPVLSGDYVASVRSQESFFLRVAATAQQSRFAALLDTLGNRRSTPTIADEATLPAVLSLATAPATLTTEQPPLDIRALFAPRAAAAQSRGDRTATPAVPIAPSAGATVVAISGRRVDFDKLRGHVVLAHFWATWCPISAAEAPALREAYERLHTQGFEVIGVAIDSSGAADIATARTELGFTWEQVHERDFDGTLAKRFKIDSVPDAVLIGRDGTPLARGDAARGAELQRRLTDLFPR